TVILPDSGTNGPPTPSTSNLTPCRSQAAHTRPTALVNAPNCNGRSSNRAAHVGPSACFHAAKASPGIHPAPRNTSLPRSDDDAASNRASSQSQRPPRCLQPVANGFTAHTSLPRATNQRATAAVTTDLPTSVSV